MGTLQLPNGFVDLSTAYNSQPNTLVSVIGVVVDIRPPKLTMTREHMMTISILDHRLRDSAIGSNGLTVRFFRKDENSLPTVQSIGDVILLRGIPIKSFSGSPIAVSSIPIPMVVFPAASIPEPAFVIAYQDRNRIEALGKPFDVEKITLQEQKYAIDLHHDLSTKIRNVADSAQERAANKREAEASSAAIRPRKKARPSVFGTKFRYIKEVGNMEWANVCGEVVKSFPSSWGYDLYISDYTENQMVWNYPDPLEEAADKERDGDEFNYTSRGETKFPGPYGWLTLKVNVKYPHAQALNEISVGDYVLLKNVKFRIQKEGSKLEGDMWPDNIEPEKINVEKLQVSKLHEHHPRWVEVQELIERREKYWSNRAQKTATERPPEQNKPTSNRGRKKQAQKARKEEKKANQQLERQREQAIVHSKPPPTIPPPKGKGKSDTNPHIRCAHQEIPIETLPKILDAWNTRHTTKTPTGETYIIPFINAKYRASVRVIDYEPKNIQDFAYLSAPEDQSQSEFSNELSWSNASRKWEWFFSLLLEGQKEKVWVHVDHENAQHLFGNDMADPTDLRNDSRLVAKVKEKMCILWGNLEEKAAGEELSNRPFECCLTEYGVKLDDDDPETETSLFGYKKMFRLWGTRIL
ncbi:Hypothetical protein R9X50_00483700 [Acrodontium crateriforme]|uniref:Protection of telomeres protein 1 n=1 Tax=Acrodontium crateriforme TaxID=150365 RepID=A0AAQ3M6A1_9PEZI|nr:Hypothetical protein R9X50_00483700 [Acrodontium crateriforme]